MSISELYFIQTNLICIFLLVCVLVAYFRNYFSDSKSKYFILELFLICIYCLLDMSASIMGSNVSPNVTGILYAVDSLYISLPIVMILVWDTYVSRKFVNVDKDKGILKKILYGISIIFFIASLSSYFTGFAFYLDGLNLYHRAIGAYLIPAWCFCILIYDIVKLIIITHKTNSIECKFSARTSILFGIPAIFTSVFQLLHIGTSLTQVGFTLGFIIVYMFDQSNKISKDELTGINNRREFDKQFESIICTSDSMLVGMIDLDFFKEINDKNGHLVGDEVLKDIARLLARTCADCSEYGKFMIARFGGDEFIILGRDFDKKAASILRKTINDKLDDLNNKNKYDFPICLSIGFAQGNIKGKSDAREMLYKADLNLYKYKEINHQKHQKNK